MLLATLAGCTKVSGQGRAGQGRAGQESAVSYRNVAVFLGGAGDALRIYFASEVVRYLIFDDGFL
jgi:hypothetical protein